MNQHPAAALVASLLLASCAAPDRATTKPPMFRAPPVTGAAPAPASPGTGLLANSQDCGPSGAWAPITITNADSNRAAWVTFYENRAGGGFGDPPIVYAQCWVAGETRMSCVEKRNYILRAEMVSRDGVTRAKDCADGSVSCDTDGAALIDMSSGTPRATTIKQDGWGCYWDPWTF